MAFNVRPEVKSSYMELPRKLPAPFLNSCLLIGEGGLILAFSTCLTCCENQSIQEMCDDSQIPLT